MILNSLPQKTEQRVSYNYCASWLALFASGGQFKIRCLFKSICYFSTTDSASVLSTQHGGGWQLTTLCADVSMIKLESSVQ